MKSTNELTTLKGVIGEIYEERYISPTAKTQRFRLKTDGKNYFIEAFNNYFLLEGLKVGDEITVEVNSKMYKERPVDYLYTMVDSPIIRKRKTTVIEPRKQDSRNKDDDPEKQMQIPEVIRMKDKLREVIYYELYKNTENHFNENKWSLSDLTAMLRIVCDSFSEEQLINQPQTIKKWSEDILSAEFETIANFIIKNGQGRFQIWTNRSFTSKLKTTITTNS